jgi:hypothetical protein
MDNRRRVPYVCRHTKKRNKLLPSRTEQLVYVFSNLQLLEHVQGNTVAGQVVPWLEQHTPRAGAESEGEPDPLSDSDSDDAVDDADAAGSESNESSSDSDSGYTSD